MTFGGVVLAALVALFLGVLLLVAGLWLAGPRLVDRTVDRLLRATLRTPYSFNLASFLSLVRRADPQTFLENLLRATRDTALERPMGPPRIFSPWDRLVFNPAQVVRLPTASRERIDTRTVIGPSAERPLHLDTPLVIAGMSFGGALSAPVKVALALAANAVGTATNTGENYLPEERQAAHKLIVQYHRGDWPRSAQHHPAWLERADAIEIQIGQGAQAAAELVARADTLTPAMRDAMGLKPGEDAVIRSRLDGVNRPDDLVALIRRLKETYPVPVGLKLVPSARLLDDLEAVMPAEPDFLVLDGGEGGTHAGPPILQDDFGLPLMAALTWTDRWLREHGRRDRVSIVAAGGLKTPGECLKALALGADAVYLGFAVLMALAAAEGHRVLPWRPPESLFYGTGQARGRLHVERAAEAVARFLRSSTDEIRYGLQALGHERLSQLSRRDLVALDPLAAAMADVPALVAPPRQAPPPFLRRHREEHVPTRPH
ncbi:MAG: FMN-binding glutamate synthase family protein [Actinomycetia bacterium]|nr:FMN-binding glutamate synthase family protein [Actinomycetes bacterium]